VLNWVAEEGPISGGGGGVSHRSMSSAGSGKVDGNSGGRASLDRGYREA
jgi:hypothetical protein